MLTGSESHAAYYLPDGTKIWFGEGPGTVTHQDEWCVFVTGPDGSTRIPKDEEYFTDLKEVASRHGNWEIYKAFLSVYEMTTPIVDPAVLGHIATVADQFHCDELTVHTTLATLYFTMIAEENKRPAWRWPLKKTVKKLGVYELLVCDYTPRQAANASRWPQTAKSNRARLTRYEAEERTRLAREAAARSNHDPSDDTIASDRAGDAISPQQRRSEGGHG